LKVLTRGDYFSGRALLSSEDINIYKDAYKKLSMISKPAQVSIVREMVLGLLNNLIRLQIQLLLKCLNYIRTISNTFQTF